MSDRRDFSPTQLGVGIAIGCAVAVIPATIVLFFPSLWIGTTPWYKSRLIELLLLCFFPGVALWQGTSLFLYKGLRAERWPVNEIERLRRVVNRPLLQYAAWAPLTAAIVALTLPGHRLDRAIWLSFLSSPGTLLWKLETWLAVPEETMLQQPFKVKPFVSDHWGERSV